MPYWIVCGAMISFTTNAGARTVSPARRRLQKRAGLTIGAGTIAVVVSIGNLHADGAKIPAQPTEPAAAKAYGVFDQACAGCHQTGRLKGLARPAASLGHILDLDALARNPAWVRPGNPDASPLYTAIQSRNMPIAASGEIAPADVSAADLGAIRDWIEQLPTTAACTSGSSITAAAVVTAIATVTQTLAAKQAASTRFISLVPLHNTCASAAEIESARQAVAWVINSLSLALDPVKLEPVALDGLILKVELPAIAWEPARWDRLARRAPAAPFVAVDAATRAALSTTLPLINGDWLAATATRAPFYYDLLGVPDTLHGLYSSLRIDIANTKRGAADRIGLKTSAVARGNRLLERRAFANGAAWIASEFAPTAGRPDLFDLTVAAATATGAAQLNPDATLVHFDLPNGFPAFFIANANGQRVNDIPQSVLTDESHPSARIGVAQSCASCHSASSGAPVALAPGRADDLKARLSSEPNLPKDVRDKLLALHSEPAATQRKIDEDRQRFERALSSAGIDPKSIADGQDPLQDLIARYRRPVAAAELADLADMELRALATFGKQASPSVADALDRIAFGAIPRAAADAILAEVAIKRGLHPAAASSTAAAQPSSSELQTAPGELVLKAARPVFHSGDLLSVTARAGSGCHLTIMTLDTHGRATVLFPNEFDVNNFIDAGREIRIPGEKAPYQFRLRDKGQETLIGICASTAKPVDGIRHNFEFQRFTELGDYRAFLNRNWDTREPADTKSPAPKPRRNGEPPPAIKPADALTTSRDVQARTAIRITVE